MSNEVEEIWSEARLELEANHLMGKNYQFLIEEAIGNLAALKAISTSDEELIKN